MQKSKINNRLTFVTTLILLGLGGLICSGCATIRACKETSEEISGEIINPIFFDLTTAVSLYYDENSKWPNNAEELREFALEHKLALNLDKFESLSFLPKPNGNLVIEFTTYKDYTYAEGKIKESKLTSQGTLEFSPSIKGK